MSDPGLPRRDRPRIARTLLSTVIFGAAGWCAAAVLVGLLDPLGVPASVVVASRLGVTVLVIVLGLVVASFYARVHGPLALRVGDAATIGGLAIIVLVMALSLLGTGGPPGRSDASIGPLLELAVACLGMGIACVAGFFATRIPGMLLATRATLLVVAAFGAGLAAAGVGVLAGIIA